MAREEFDQLLDQPDNRSYRSHIHFCLLSDAMTEVSATAVREGLATGSWVEDLLPEEIAIFLAETRAFHPPLRRGDKEINAYAVRQNLLNLLFVLCSQNRAPNDFHSLLQAALADGEAAEVLRNAASPDDLS